MARLASISRRVHRIAGMGGDEIKLRLQRKLLDVFSPAINLRRIAYALDRQSLRAFPDRYVERSEGGPGNLDFKLKRLAQGGPFEPYDVALVNKAAAGLAKGYGRIGEFGAGTGLFAGTVVDLDPTAQVTASEFDARTHAWARENRAHARIEFVQLGLEECTIDQFDLAVSLEVIEHIAAYPDFLRQLARVAPTALISTPNKNRDAFASIANTPDYDDHVREWTAGEFYWVLRCFWDHVELHTVPSLPQQMQAIARDPTYLPDVRRSGVLDRNHIMIAVCRSPRRQG